MSSDRSPPYLPSFPTRRSSDLEEINPFSLLPHTAHNLQSLTIELFAYLHELASPFKEISFAAMRSEEHTRELQSRGNLVCLLLPVEEKRDEEAGRGFAVVACEP